MDATCASDWRRFLTLFLATKANFFFILVMLGAFWIAWRFGGWLRISGALQRWLPAACFFVVTAGAIAFPRDNTSDAVLQTSQHKYSRFSPFSRAARCGFG